MPVSASLIVPPAPKVHAKDLPVWRLLREIPRSSLSIWPDYAFEILFQQRSVLGLTTALVNDPDGVRHFLTTNAANYRRSRVRDPLAAMVHSYLAGPGRPTLLDIFAKSDDAFAFATGKRKRFRAAWFAAIDFIVAERKAQPASADRKDLLDILINLKDTDTGETLSSEEIRDQCATMIFGGSKTTASMMFWTCYLLTLDTAEQSRVRAEVKAFAPERAARLDDLQNWPRLRSVLLEALRLYPPVPHILREAIGSDEICGERIEPGTQVWASAWVMHRHRKFWTEPTAFMPDRFAGKAAPWVQMPSYLPFGAGPRICIGLHFALSEAQIVLGHLLSRATIALPGAKPVLPIGRGTTEPSHEPMFKLEPDA